MVKVALTAPKIDELAQTRNPPDP